MIDAVEKAFKRQTCQPGPDTGRHACRLGGAGLRFLSHRGNQCHYNRCCSRQTRSETMHPIASWWLAVRPKTLSLSATPVLVGSALALAELGSLDWLTATLTLLAALLIQAGTNLYNDAADHERGTDGADRLGPARATAQGWLSAAQVKRGAALAFAGAFLLGIYLAYVGGWPIVALGLLSIAAGYAYTGGPSPIAYSPSGELFVFLFFGVAAVAGSHYLQTHSLSLTALGAGAGLGSLAAAVLLVNNYRDLDSDRRAGKFTLCHRLERQGSRRFYGLLMLAPFLLIAADPGLWPILLALPASLWLIRRLYRTYPGPDLNRLLAATAGLQLLFGVLLGGAFLF